MANANVWIDRNHRQFIEEAPHSDAEPFLRSYLQSSDIDPLFDHCETKLGQKTFGFGDSIKRISEDEIWLTYQIQIPQIRFETGATCNECHGTGFRFFGEETDESEHCFHCDGTKKKMVAEWENGRKICQTLSALFSILEFPLEKDASSPEKQYFSIVTGLADRGCYLGGQMSPSFINLLRLLSKKGEHYELQPVIEAMKEVHKKMFMSVRNYHKHSFKAWVLDGNLVIDCPGDACGIHPSPYVGDIRDGYGTEFTCHNLDHVDQLLTLLSGLAATATMCMEMETVEK